MTGPTETRPAETRPTETGLDPPAKQRLRRRGERPGIATGLPESRFLPALLLLRSLGAMFGFGRLRGGFSRPPATDRITFGDPAARALFDLWLDGRELRCFRDDSRPEDREVPFFLDLHPADPGAPPEPLREDGFEDLRFPFSHHRALLDGRCLVRVTLPASEWRRLRTGQSPPDGEPLRQAEIPPGS